MKKNVIAHEQEIQKEVDRRYALSGFKPNGFGDSEYGMKLAILVEMYEQEEKLGKIELNREIAYLHVSDLYKACDGWY